MRPFKPNVRRLEKRRNVKRLVTALADQEESIRQEACLALTRLGGAFIGSALLTELNASNLEVRRSAAYILGEIHWREAIDPLIKIALDGKADHVLRERAVWSLSKFQDSRCAEALWRALESPDERLQRNAMNALRPIVTSESVDILIKILSDRRPKGANLIMFAVRVLGQIGDDRAIVLLLKEFGDEPLNHGSGIRDAAAKALLNFEDVRAVPAYIYLLINYDAGELGARAAKLLETTGSQTAIPYFEATLLKHEDLRFSSESTKTIATIAKRVIQHTDRPPIDTLTHLLDYSDEYVRRGTVNTLSKFDNRATSVLL
jgi:HEAT repeat protein